MTRANNAAGLLILGVVLLTTPSQALMRLVAPEQKTIGGTTGATATVQAIDSATRTLTLRDEKGQEDTYRVGPEVKRFSEVRVGDTVKLTYYESLVLAIRRPGDNDKGASASTGTTGSAIIRPGASPAGTVAIQQTMRGTVKAIDSSVPSVTITTPDGRTAVRKIVDKKHLDGLKVGDQIDITFTPALLVNIELAK